MGSGLLLKVHMKFLAVILFFILLGCQKRNSLTYLEWQAGQPTASSKLLKDVQTEASVKSTFYKKKKIEFMRQMINGRPVYNSFIKKISSETDGLELIQAQVVEEKSLSVRQISLGLGADTKVLLKKEKPSFSKIEVVADEMIYQIEGKTARLVRLVTFFDRQGAPYVALFKPDGKFIKAERVGSQFADINVNVFTEGPILSSLTEQVIKSVALSPTLSNQQIYVTSEADKKIESISSNLKFDVKDERFDQIQAFYYMNKSLQWMKDHLQVSLPERVDAVVYMGFPEKTNSAFYYQNKIRFGKGDDAVYANIVSDPSIVYHETFHALIDNLAHLPFEGEGGSINEGFADFFACLITERPYLGEASYLKGPFKRNLMLITKLDEKNGGLYHDSSIVSSLFWELKEKLGFERSKNLAIETLIRLNPATQFASFNRKILEASLVVLNGDERLILQQTLKAHGFASE